MKKFIIALVVLVLALASMAAVATAGGGNGQKPKGGDNPCPPSYHAEGDSCVHNGDGGGNCGQNQSDNGGDHGYGHKDGCGEEQPPVEPPVTPPVTPPTTPPGGHDCTFVGADKDGGVDAYGGTNDDCAPFPPAETAAAKAEVCTPIVVTQTVTKTVPGKVKVRTKIVYRTKVKVKTVVQTRVIVKTVKVYVPGLKPNGAAGKG